MRNSGISGFGFPPSGRRERWRLGAVVALAAIIAVGTAGVASAQVDGNNGAAFPKAAATKKAKPYNVDEGSTVSIPIEVKHDPAASSDAAIVTIMSGEIDAMGMFEKSAIPEALTFYGPGITVGVNRMMLTFSPTPGQRRITLTAASVVDANGANETVALEIAAANIITSTGETAATSKRRYATVTVVDAKRPVVEFKDATDSLLEGEKTTLKLKADLGPEFSHNADATVALEAMVSADGKQKVQLLKTGASYDATGRLLVKFTLDKVEETFDVQVLDDPDGMNDEVMLMLSKPTTGGIGVQVGTMATMTLTIVDDDEGDGTTTPTTPTPTPALPVFGAFVLAGGLAAAGRRRMQQQRQLVAARSAR
jgi:hypothetical protein